MKETRAVGESGKLPARHIDAFLDRLRTAHYSDVTRRKKRKALSAFSRWMNSRNVCLVDLDESATACFMERLTHAPGA